jgi:cytochrome c553
MLRRSLLMLSAAASFAVAGTAGAADAAAGKSAAGVCAECHVPAEDWKGISEADLNTMIKGVVAGSAKHPKKLELSDADVANIAAYWASVAK